MDPTTILGSASQWCAFFMRRRKIDDRDDQSDVTARNSRTEKVLGQCDNIVADRAAARDWIHECAACFGGRDLVPSTSRAPQKPRFCRKNPGCPFCCHLVAHACLGFRDRTTRTSATATTTAVSIANAGLASGRWATTAPSLPSPHPSPPRKRFQARLACAAPAPPCRARQRT